MRVVLSDVLRSSFIAIANFERQMCYSSMRTAISMASLSTSSFSTASSGQHCAYIALGSNLGDRSLKMYEAVQEIRSLGSLVATSHLYQSSPMYFTQQDPFLNAVCQIKTDLAPISLLEKLKSIEKKLGRVETFRNGPRTIDLDILLYDDKTQSSETLQIPHPKLQERSFVLKPLMDINKLIIDPVSKKNVEVLYRELLQKEPNSELTRVIPCYNHQSKKTRYLSLDMGSPIIMGILNITPDR